MTLAVRRAKGITNALAKWRLVIIQIWPNTACVIPPQAGAAVRNIRSGKIPDMASDLGRTSGRFAHKRSGRTIAPMPHLPQLSVNAVSPGSCR